VFNPTATGGPHTPDSVPVERLYCVIFVAVLGLQVSEAVPVVGALNVRTTGIV